MDLFLLFMVSAAVLGESYGGWSSHSKKPGVLIRTKRRWVLSTIELTEEMDVKYPHEVSQMFNDQTQGKSTAFQISGEGVDEGLFSINDTTGIVYVHKPVDREKKEMYHIKFDVWDRTTNKKLDRELSFDVEVQDINDMAPEFVVFPKMSSVKENTPAGYLPITLQVRDEDKKETNNSKVSVSVISQDPKEPTITAFQLDDRMVQLKFKGCFNYDKTKQYKITIGAKDHGTPQLSSSIVVTLNVNDTNSNPPQFKQKQYEAEAWEMKKYKNLLKLAVDDKDTRNTNAWRVQYFFISGNEEEIFKIDVINETNEGVLSIDKEKNYDLSTIVNLKIGVKNLERLCLCVNDKITCDEKALPPPDSAQIKIKMIDTNDPPVFEKTTAEVYVKEETEPGAVLYTPKVHDEDSTNITFLVIEDKAGWVSVDEKTGAITSTKRMDRESPLIDPNSVYKVVIAAVDDGVPPCTSSCTINIHLNDINDNVPTLVNSTLIMCVNRENTIKVPVQDLDGDPFSGPFFFSLGDDPSLKELWKLDPDYGKEGGLVSLKALPYGNYSVPLLIQDQQNMVSSETLEVIFCDCEDADYCRDKLSTSFNIGDAAIGLIITGLLLLLLFFCDVVKEKFEYLDNDEGNQTLIKYNQEGGGAECKAEPTLMTQTLNVMQMDGQKQAFTKQSQMGPAISTEENYNSEMETTNYNQYWMSMKQHRESKRSFEGRSKSMTWTSSSRHGYLGNSSNFQRSLSMRSDQHLEGQILRKLSLINSNQADNTVYEPTCFADEGHGSRSQSLDKLSLGNPEEDLQFLEDLGPSFKPLAKICEQNMQVKNIQL